VSAFQFLQQLQNEVGSRRAGTAGETRAQEWLQARCQELGLSVELDEFSFIGFELYRPLFQLFILTALALSIALALLGRPTWSGFVLLAFFVYFNFGHKRLDVRLARTRSNNVLAGLRGPFSEYVADPAKGPAVLICAHYDTPRNAPPWAVRLRDLMRVLGPLGLLGVLIHGVFLILRGLAALLALAGVAGPAVLLEDVNLWVVSLAAVMFAPLLLLMALTALAALVRRADDSPGADDNGSGTALVLELARRFAEQPPGKLELFFAFWGAEELGLF
jgi:acetylornithine deacetylase/succinyl-diaminopimelate desuccinylase-like protein